MKTTTTTNKLGGFRHWKLLTGIWAAGLLAGALTGCSTTKQVSQNEKDFSGFLGDYSMLQKGDGNEANYIYIDKNVNFAKYTKVYIKPIELWKSDEPDSALGKLSPENQQMLISFFNTELADSLGKDFQIVDHPDGPDVLVIHGAITDAGKSKPVLNLFSTVYPAALVLSYAKQAFTGTGTGVGKVMVEAEFTDGATGQRVAAIVDERAGTKALRTKFDGSWGDVKLAFDWWAQRLDARLELLKKGDYSTDAL
ncbi:MAG TPA: DUF3313 domain-containing protein [Verrucomicrobiae bacterium]|jgi:hypothetical protein|nr:DUF3313 domain-containing protein [Verrucomicrobiae bacterium]